MSRNAEKRRNRWRRGLLLLLLCGVCGLAAPVATAEPVDVNSVSQNLRQYVVGTPEWTTSPWMTAPGCRERGGSWSVYTEHVLADTPDLLKTFQPDFGGAGKVGRARAREMLAGYRRIASHVDVPAGYCVDVVKRWAGTTPGFKPFGFAWGDAPAGSAHTTGYVCSDNVGADNAPCGGFYVSCSGATTQRDRHRCQAWNAFSDDYVTRVKAMRDKAISDHPATGKVPTHTVVKSPGEIMQDVIDWTVQHGMRQVTSFVIDGVTKLWAIFLKITVDYTSPNLSGAGFGAVYNLVAGVALALAFLGWLVSLATSWKQGRFQFSLFGGIKAFVGVSLAGVGAILMLQLADECTTSLAHAGANLADQADFTASLAKANPLVALVVGVLIAIFLIFATIFLVIHSALVLMWALMGSIAAAGQVHPASSGWLMKWAGRLTALAWAKFAMVAVMLLAQALLLPLDAGEDPIKQVVDIVQGLALSFLLITTPYLLWELVDFVGDRVGGGAASGGRATQLASAGARGAAGKLGGPAGAAVSTMMSSAADIGRKFTGGATGGKGTGGNGSGGGSGGGSGHTTARTPGRAHAESVAAGGNSASSKTGAGQDRKPGSWPGRRAPSGQTGQGATTTRGTQRIEPPSGSGQHRPSPRGRGEQRPPRPPTPPA